jgi:hypothetical protein
MSKINLSTPIFSIFTLSVLTLAWLEKDEYWYTAENGLGYAFGIIGASMMLLLLLYPARKYWKPMRRTFKVSQWFKFHMIFGVWGPVLILLHSNFSLGSLNSNVALFSMLLVAGSGLVGRFVYQKLHRGLYGEQIAFTDLDSDYQKIKQTFKTSALFNDELYASLDAIEQALFRRKVPILTSMAARRKISKLQRDLKKTVKKTKQNSEEYAENITQFKQINNGLVALKKMAVHALYTRLFSLWHIFHLPIFFMMIITAIIHIFAVHIY